MKRHTKVTVIWVAVSVGVILCVVKWNAYTAGIDRANERVRVVFGEIDKNVKVGDTEEHLKAYFSHKNLTLDDARPIGPYYEFGVRGAEAIFDTTIVECKFWIADGRIYSITTSNRHISF